MKIKIIEDNEDVIETKIENIQISDTGEFQFMLKSGEYFIATQCRGRGQTKTIFYIEKFESPEDLSNTIDMLEIELNKIEVYFMLNDKWEKINITDSFED